MHKQELDAQQCNDLCRALLDTISKHTKDTRVAVLALAHAAGNVVGSADEVANVLENFMTRFASALTEYSGAKAGVVVVDTSGPCPVHGAKCPDDTVH